MNWEDILFFKKIILLKYSGFTMLLSVVQQSDSVICIYMFFFKNDFYWSIGNLVYIHLHTLFQYDLLQDTEYNSLCYTVELCCLSIMYIRFYIY